MSEQSHERESLTGGGYRPTASASRFGSPGEGTEHKGGRVPRQQGGDAQRPTKPPVGGGGVARPKRPKK